MTSEPVIGELLNIAKFDLYRIINTLIESLHDCKYNVSDHPCSKKPSFDEFCIYIEEVKSKKEFENEEYNKSKKKKKVSSIGKKISKLKKRVHREVLDSIPEDGKKTIKKNNTIKKFTPKYFDSSLPFFENCLTFVATCTTFGTKYARPLDKKGDMIIVLFSLMPQIGKPALTSLETYIKKLDLPITNILLVSQMNPSPNANSLTIPKLKLQYNIRVLLHHQLLVNITQHVLVKPHERLAEEERKEFLGKFKGLTEETLSSMPIIRLNDPVSLYWDFRRGDIIRIKNVGAAESYRMVEGTSINDEPTV